MSLRLNSYHFPTFSQLNILSLIMFVCIVIMFFPFLISSGLKGYENPVSKSLLAIGYLCQIFLISITLFLNRKVSLKKSQYKFILSALCLVITQMTVLFTNTVIGYINLLDLLNIFAKCINFFVFFIIMKNLSISEKSFSSFMHFIIAFGIIACIYNLIAYYDLIGNIFAVSNAYLVNIKSFFPNRNGFAQYLLIAIIANTFILKKKTLLINLGIYVVLFFSSITTLSRTGIFSIFIFFFLTTFFFIKAKRVPPYLYLLFILILFIFSLVTISFWDIVSNYIIRYDTIETGASRLEYWKVGISIAFNSNILLGVGYYRAIETAQLLGSNISQFHNFYLDTLLSGGILELLVYICVFLVVVFSIYRSSMPENRKRIFYSTYITLAIYAFFESASIFSIGYVDSLFTIFFISIPLLYTRNFDLNKSKYLNSNVLNRNIKNYAYKAFN